MQGELHGRLRLILDAPDLETARRLKAEVVQQYADRAPKAVERLEEGSDEAMAVMALPERYRKRLRTTNALERPNEESRRRERAVRIFPNTKPAQRLIGAVLMESDEAWTTGAPVLGHGGVLGVAGGAGGEARGGDIRCQP